ncbi:hypothetical protein EIN_172760 [Entamoeba invadens IP1]|uniref:Uncharacterized protein n=1 Tax=Entamoeba invadens IP1 TaxID=370355 RepID=A0A0A1TVZ8_ENTIV|nr:hypothetical protein EIN_172760 [Entamoeba invadens IP1]ELP84631.1 hypothetical protein EIN_172760 [Entamoeba invadens IP1]|eukprot:XP_004183977.1 hypothetical protein EIN_172760 [Entamoeba invadens IP1]
MSSKITLNGAPLTPEMIQEHIQNTSAPPSNRQSGSSGDWANSTDSLLAQNSSGEETLSKPVDIFQEYLDNLNVSYEKFENYENLETNEIMMEIHVTKWDKCFMITFFIVGIFFPPLLLVGLIAKRKYKNSQKLGSIYQTTLYLLYLYMLLFASAAVVAIIFGFMQI